MQISREDCNKVREEKKQINKRFQEEILFDLELIQFGGGSPT